MARNAANEQHLKLLKEQLDRLTPGSRAHQKISDEIKRQERYAAGIADRVGPRPFNPPPRGGGPRAGGFDDLFGDFMRGQREAEAKRRMANFESDQQMALSRLYVYGGIILGSTGSSISSVAKSAEANRKTNLKNKKAYKRHKSNRITGQVGYATTGAGLGMALGPFLGFALGDTAAAAKLLPRTGLEKRYLGEGANPSKVTNASTFATTVAGAGLGYAVGRHQMPINKPNQKMWIEYKRVQGGQTKKIRRKNPYYMKPSKSRKKNPRQKVGGKRR